MNNQKIEIMNLYLDFYENLLTERQKKICNYYYREDYSLAEIAELESVSRAAIHDALKRSGQILNDLELKLHCVSSFTKRMDLYEKIKEYNHEKVNFLVDACIETE